MKTIKKWLGNFARDDSGGMMVDFTVSITLVLMVTFGILDFSRLVYVDHFLATAARSATRYAMVRGSSWDGTACNSTSVANCAATSTDISRYVKGTATDGIAANTIAVTTTWPGTTPSGAACGAATGNNSPGCVVAVHVAYSFNFLLPFLPSDALALSSDSKVAIAQ